MNAALAPSPMSKGVIIAALAAALFAVTLGFSSSNNRASTARPLTGDDTRLAFASRAFDKDTDSFRRLKYRIDVEQKWSGGIPGRKRRRTTSSSSLFLGSNPISNLVERASSFIATLTEEQDDNAIDAAIEEQRKSCVGKVIRTAYRKNQGDKSKPGRPGYTTRKDSQPFIDIEPSGVSGDYNHYRTIALGSTPDRAVCILTSDVLAYVRDEPIFSRLQDGDLGENVLIDQLSYAFFEVGKMYRFSKNEGGVDGAIIEITEPAVPCASECSYNAMRIGFGSCQKKRTYHMHALLMYLLLLLFRSDLCNLSFINTELLEPRQRIEKCQSFIEKLGIDDGFRGWYARVVVPGRIMPGDSVELVAA